MLCSVVQCCALNVVGIGTADAWSRESVRLCCNDFVAKVCRAYIDHTESMSFVLCRVDEARIVRRLIAPDLDLLCDAILANV